MAVEFAWPGADRPGTLAFTHVPEEEIAEAIRDVVATRHSTAKSGQLRALNLNSGPVGRYALETQAGTYFVRVSTRLGHPDLEDRLTRWLEEAGVAVNGFLCSGLELNHGGKSFRIDVRPFLHGRHFDDSDDDLERVSRSIRRCHRALRNFPYACSIRDLATRRMGRLADALDRIARAIDDPAGTSIGLNAAWIRKHEAWLREMVGTFRPNGVPPHDAQCLHGEIHRANVIFIDDEAVLVDFEEAVHTFAPPAWDLAYLVTRFCLHDDPDDAQLSRRLAVVERQYGPLPRTLGESIRNVSHTCIALLIDQHIADGAPALSEEADKFLLLHDSGSRIDGALGTP